MEKKKEKNLKEKEREKGEGEREKMRGKERKKREEEKKNENEKNHEDKSNEDKSNESEKNNNSTTFVFTTSQISSVVETLLHGRFVTPKSVIIDGDDIMKSPPTSPSKLYGASCISGGIFRGQAVGNALNAADFSDPNNNNYIGPVCG